MGILDKLLGARSRYDKRLPYTYEARVDLLGGGGEKPIFDHYFADTLCGLIGCLMENHIKPARVQLYGVYQRRESPMILDPCLGEDGAWLQPPALCESLAETFRVTRDERWRGHSPHGDCSFRDRNTEGVGPY